MISVGLSETKAKLYLGRLEKCYSDVHVSIGCINSPSNVTLTGDKDQLCTLEKWIKQDSIMVHRLLVNVAYHSPHMNDIADEYLLNIAQIESGVPTLVPMISSVTGAKVLGEELCRAEYWVRNMVYPVQFLRALTVLSTKMEKKRRRLGHPVQHQIDITDFLEIGPHSALKAPIRETLRFVPDANDIRYHSLLIRQSSAVESILTAAGLMYSLGFPVDLLAVINRGRISSGNLLTDLPEYSFNHTQSHWLEGRASKSFRFRRLARSDFLGVPLPDWNRLDAQWRYIIRQAENPWIEDHQVSKY